MFSGSNESVKPLIGMVWFGIVVILLVGILLGNISPAEAAVKALIALFISLAWATGLFRLLFFFDLNSSFLTQLKGRLIGFASSYFYPVLFLGIAFFNDSLRYSRAVYIIALSILSLIWLIVLYRRSRLIEDTASTTLNSAAQGYAELEGKVTLYDGEVVRGPDKELPVMVWYRKYFYSSGAGFILDDDKGRCTIDPRDAEVITPRYHYSGHSYHAIYPGETIYVLGFLQTLSKQRTEIERKQMIGSKLVEWKRHHLRFLNFFDKNHDGKIDDQEMCSAVDAAERSIDNELEEVYLEPATHIVSSPEDGRPFILSSIHPDELIARYKRAMLFHLFVWVTLTIFALAMQVQ